VAVPIYAYRCESCGYAQDVLQKISDPLLTVCPACAATTFSKQITAAGFQLKGTGWYATDFKGGSAKPASNTGASAGGKTSDGGGTTADAASSAPAEGSSAASKGGATPAADSGSAGSKQ
jgi:putative FmdB family regulatory protein